MGVYIKGMEMPKSCVTCRWHERWGCGLTGIGTNTAEGCPLVSIPAPHGRLIDEGELKEWIMAWFTMHRGYHPYSKSNLIPSTEIVDILDRLPTIIGAEEGSLSTAFQSLSEK